MAENHQHPGLGLSLDESIELRKQKPYESTTNESENENRIQNLKDITERKLAMSLDDIINEEKQKSSKNTFRHDQHKDRLNKRHNNESDYPTQNFHKGSTLRNDQRHNNKRSQHNHENQNGQKRQQKNLEIHLIYNWTKLENDMDEFSARLFETEIVKIRSNGEVELDSGGFHTLRTKVALSTILGKIEIKITEEDGKDKTEESNENQKHHNWVVVSEKSGWSLNFQDKMKISAFPKRLWGIYSSNLRKLPTVITHQLAGNSNSALNDSSAFVPPSFMPFFPAQGLIGSTGLPFNPPNSFYPFQMPMFMFPQMQSYLGAMKRPGQDYLNDERPSKKSFTKSKDIN